MAPNIPKHTLYLLLPLAAALAGCDSEGDTGPYPPPTFPAWRGIPNDAQGPTPDFTLRDQHGRPFRLSDRKGRAVVLFFGFVHCPDVCPTTLSTWKQIRQALGERAPQVEFVFITVDPERDTPQLLREHLGIFSDAFVGLTGTLEELDPVYKAYGVTREKVVISTGASGYLVDHSTMMYLIDPNQECRVLFPYNAPAEDVLHDLNQLLDS